ncbi:MAG: EAL domain-containing protein [Leptolyngbyaceae cyanobacterium SM1_1_3]|nr:EAL domain-containing protein [Leptolyngbyaceae cyanobacterium SM1_1_3]
MEYRFRHKDGNLRWISSRLTSNWDAAAGGWHVMAADTDITERKQAELALQERDRQLSTLISNLPGVVYRCRNDSFWSLEFASQSIVNLTGYTAEDFTRDRRVTYAELIHPDDWPSIQQAVETAVEQQSAFQITYRICTAAGVQKWVWEQGRGVFAETGEFLAVEGLILEVTQQKQMALELQQLNQALEQRIAERTAALIKSETHLRLAQRIAGVGSWEFDLRSQQITWTREIFRIFGRSTQLGPPSYEELMHYIHPDDRDRHNQVIREAAEQCQNYEEEFRFYRPDGNLAYLNARGEVVLNDIGEPVSLIGTALDITERKQIEAQLRQVNQELTDFNTVLEEQVEQRTQQLQQRILYDDLTQLPSRVFLLQHIAQAILDCQQGVYSQFALLYLDCDQFKLINSSLGHDVGDRLLIAICDRLQTCLSAHDLLARVGEDEFCILRLGLSSAGEAEALASHCLSALSAPFLVGDYDTFVSACIGVAIGSTEYQQPQDIFRDADTAMYKAKAKGKGCYQVFDQVMQRTTVRRLHLENDLQRALKREEFCLHYQPIIHLNSQRVWGFEALVRWQHPQRGLIAPGEFVPCLEETGLIVPAGMQILRQACQQLRNWQRRQKPLTLSVNLSVRQFAHPLLIAEIDQILAETGVDPKGLKLEITESAIMDNPESAIALIEQLRSRQVRISIDDFGTGYSSLSYLHQFPVDSLKIDHSFINRIDQANKNSKIVQAISNLGHTLGMSVIAEGIETSAQLLHLKQLGCEYGQGFLFAKAMSSAQVSHFLARC